MADKSDECVTLHGQNSDQATSFQGRMEIVCRLAGNATRMAKAAGISRRAIGDYLAGTGEPMRPRLIAIARAANVSVQWLATGEGPMRLADAPGAPPPPAPEAPAGPPAIDEHLLGLIFDGISRISRDDNLRLPPIELGRLSGRILGDLMAAYDNPDDRRTALRLALQQLRRELLTPPANGDSGKRSA